MKTLTEAGIGGAKHCIFCVHVVGDDGQPDIVDFAVETPVMARQWVDGLSMLLHTGSVGIGLQVRQAAGRFIVVLANDGSPSAVCGQFNHDDVIEAVDTHPLTERTTFEECVRKISRAPYEIFFLIAFVTFGINYCVWVLRDTTRVAHIADALLQVRVAGAGPRQQPHLNHPQPCRQKGALPSPPPPPHHRMQFASASRASASRARRWRSS